MSCKSYTHGFSLICCPAKGSKSANSLPKNPGGSASHWISRCGVVSRKQQPNRFGQESGKTAADLCRLGDTVQMSSLTSPRQPDRQACTVTEVLSHKGIRSHHLISGNCSFPGEFRLLPGERRQLRTVSRVGLSESYVFSTKYQTPWKFNRLCVTDCNSVYSAALCLQQQRRNTQVSGSQACNTPLISSKMPGFVESGVWSCELSGERLNGVTSGI